MNREIFYLGRVPDEEMVYLYRAANVVVYLSLYEGFGLPVLETMASKTPLLCSNTSSLPEICDNTSILVNPKDSTNVKKYLYKILIEKKL